MYICWTYSIACLSYNIIFNQESIKMDFLVIHLLLTPYDYATKRLCKSPRGHLKYILICAILILILMSHLLVCFGKITRYSCYINVHEIYRTSLRDLHTNLPFSINTFTMDNMTNDSVKNFNPERKKQY